MSRSIRLAAAVTVAATVSGGARLAAEPTEPGLRSEIRAVGPDVPPDLPQSVYRDRRDRLIGRLGGCAAALRSFATDDEPDPYFYYLTGIEEAGAVLVLAPRARVNRQVLYLPPRNPGNEIWTGYKEPLSPRLRAKYKVDAVSVTRGAAPRSLQNGIRRARCYAHLRFPGKHQAVGAKELGRLLSGYQARSIQRWEDLEHMRSVKEAAEVARIRKAIAITNEGHAAAVRAMRPGVVERVVAAAIRDGFFAHGATGLAFPSIVGSGPDGAVLHWVKNDRALTENDLVVVDIGASYGHYAADITRTYPVSGRFSARQRKIYDIVLRVQNLVISRVKPGVSIDQLNRIASDEILAAGYELPHSIGHFVGIEVHDVGDRDGPLEAGMVITVEPGIYLRGQLGVRIEDMVLVKSRGSELLTRALPRKAEDVEAWMKKVRAEKKE